MTVDDTETTTNDITRNVTELLSTGKASIYLNFASQGMNLRVIHSNVQNFHIIARPSRLMIHVS